MSCPTDAQLRAHVDVAAAGIAGHVGDCPPCADRLTALRETARFAATAIVGLDADAPDAPDDVDVDDALAAAAAAAAATTVTVTTPTPARHNLRLPLGIAAGVVALLVAALVIVTPTGRQAAADLLAGFRSERIAVVAFDPEQPRAGFEELEQIVDVEVDEGRRRPVDDLDEAAAVAGFAPSPVSGVPDDADLADIHASAPGSVRLIFSADRTPDLPARLDGAQLVVSVPGTVASSYETADGVLVVAEAGQVDVDAAGTDLEDIRGYLLDRPEVPDDLARQLLAIDDWTTTLPIPVPVDRAVWQETTVAGAPALMVSDPMGSGLLWAADGRIHAIGAQGLDVDALRAIADGVR